MASFINYNDYVTPAASYGLGAAQAQRQSASNLVSKGGSISYAPVDYGNFGNGQFDLNLLSKGVDLAPKTGLFSGYSSLPSNFVGAPTAAQAGMKGFVNANLLTPIDQFGASLGFANPTATSGLGSGFSGFGAGEGGTGMLGSSTTLSGALSGAGIGYMMGTLNPWTDNQKQSQVGGTIGGAIGSMILPGIGTVIGGALGSLVGGMIGPGKGNSWSTFGFTTGTKDTLGGTPAFFDKRNGSGVGQAVYKDFGTYLQSVEDKFGVDLSGIAFSGGYNQKYGGGTGYYLSSGNAGNINFDPNDNASKNQAYQTALLAGLKQKGVADDDLLTNIRSFNSADYIQKQVQQLQSETMLKQNRSAQGVPLVKAAAPSSGETFSSFLDTYKNNQQTNKVV